MLTRILFSASLTVTLSVAVGCLFGVPEARKKDLALTDAVQSVLSEDTETDLNRVDVYTEDAVVYLGGELQHFASKMRAEQLTRKVPGVKKVFNKIEVEP
jgi:osmotically-inducible protein OsmY